MGKEKTFSSPLFLYSKGLFRSLKDNTAPRTPPDQPNVGGEQKTARFGKGLSDGDEWGSWKVGGLYLGGLRKDRARAQGGLFANKSRYM
jgi:hypothetical protein